MRISTLEVFIYTLLVSLLFACGREGKDDSVILDDADSLGIIGGLPSGQANILNAGCTVTVIGPRTVIGVAHCLHPTMPSTGVRTVTLKSGRKVNINFTAHPSYRDKEAYDISIGIAPSDLEVVPKMLAVATAQLGGATMIGYGCNARNGAGYGTQRVGTVSISKVYDGGLMGKGFEVCGGDSGGPLLQASRIIGIISRSRGATTYFARVDQPHIRNWILSMATKYNAPICGFQAKGCQAQLYPAEITKFTNAVNAADKLVLSTQALITTLSNKINTEATNIANLKTLVTTQSNQVKQKDTEIAAAKKAGTPTTTLDSQRATLVSTLTATQAKLTKANENITLLRTQLADAKGALNKHKADKVTAATELRKYKGF